MNGGSHAPGDLGAAPFSDRAAFCVVGGGRGLVLGSVLLDEAVPSDSVSFSVAVCADVGVVREGMYVCVLERGWLEMCRGGV